jgi:Domain of Unknown Function with PDB structure (DUF3857)
MPFANLARKVLPAGFLVLSIFAPAQDRGWRPVDPQDLQLKEIKQVPGAEGVLLYYADEIDDVDHSEFFYSRIKLFTDGGKHRANVEIPMLEKGSVTDLLARTIHPDGKIVDMVERPFEKVVFKGKGLRVKVLAFTLPQVGAGDIIEYQYQLHYGDKGLRAHHWTVQHDLFAQKEHFRFHFDKHRSVRWLPTTEQQPHPEYDAVNSLFHMEAENIAPFEAEEQMPPEDDYKWQVRFFYINPLLSSPYTYWYETAKWASRGIDEYVGKHKEIAGAATDAVGTETDPEKKLRKLYARAQEIRNLTYERHRTEKEQKSEDLKENKNVMDVLRHGYGDRSDITLFFIALARGAGFSASAAYVAGRSTRFFDREVLSFGQLDSEVALVNLNGKEVFLDPGTRFCPYGLMRWFRTGTSAMDMGDPGRFITTPSAGEDSAIIFRSAELKLGVDGAVKGEVRLEFYSSEALERRLSALETDEAGRKKELEEELKLLLPANATVEMTNSMHWEKEEESLLAIFRVEIPEFASAAGKRILIPVALFQPKRKRTLKSGPRKYPIYYQYAYTEHDNISVELPQGYSLETLAAPQNASTKFAKYSISASTTSNYVNLERSLKLGGVFFTVDRYEELRDFFGKVQAADELQTVLRQEQTAAAQPN